MHGDGSGGDDHNHDHDHHHDHDEASTAFAEALLEARGGLRSLVVRVIETLDDGSLFVPLAEELADTPLEQEVELNGELSFRPHMLLDQEENAHVVAYTNPELAEELAETLGWATAGAELQFLRLPARSVLSMALEPIDGTPVAGIAVNPSTEDEVVLQRDEVQSILAGQAIPLVGYVEELPEGLEDNTQVVEGASPPPAALLKALDQAKAKLPLLVSYKVETTFNPERDREPHLTITLFLARKDAPRGAIADDVMELVAPHLPPPGYTDIVFKDAPN